MSVMYRVEFGQPAPVAVECEVPSYPHKDADGKTIFENTHFGWEDEAWEKLECEQSAGVSLEAREVARLREELAKREKSLVDSVLVLEQIRKNRKEREFDAE